MPNPVQVVRHAGLPGSRPLFSVDASKAAGPLMAHNYSARRRGRPPGRLLVVAPAEANPEPGNQVSQVRPGRLHR